MFLHFFWDYDGTLFDSYPHMTWAFRLALKDFGFERTSEEVIASMKHSLGQCARRYADETGIPYEELMKKFRDYDRQNYEGEVRPYPYAAEVCRSIAEKGGKNYLYTHSGRYTWGMIKKYGFGDAFCDGVTSEQNFPLKPAPDALLYLIEKHKLQKEQCIMVGDRDIDLTAGFNAGISGCLFDPDGYFQDFEVPYRVTSLKELEEVLVK